MKIVFMGGGTGLSCLAQHAAEFLKENPSEFTQLTVIQHPYDDGGHSGKIVDEYQIFGPGDFRKSILAVSKPWMDPDTYKAFTRRTWHPEQPGSTEPTILLDEPPLGNLIMLSGMLKYGNVDPGRGLLEGIKVFSDACRIQKSFRVIPISLDMATLSADLADGSTILGQSKITKHFDFDKKKIVSVKLVPPNGMPYPRIYEETRRAILEADKIVITPGSFWTSIWPNTLPEGFREAMTDTRAKIIMIVNLVTEKSEASLWDSGEFVEKLFGVIGRPFQAIIFPDWKLEVQEWKKTIRGGKLGESEEKNMNELLRKYAEQEFFPIQLTTQILSKFSSAGYTGRADEIIRGRFISWNGKSFSHNKHTVRKILDL